MLKECFDLLGFIFFFKIFFSVEYDVWVGWMKAWIPFYDERIATNLPD